MNENDIKEIENRIYELEQLIRYEEEKQKVCGYGSTDLVYLEELETELEELLNKIYE